MVDSRGNRTVLSWKSFKTESTAIREINKITKEGFRKRDV